MAKSIKDIARFAGVSIATVSRVMNGNRRVSPEIRRKVEEILKRESYFPNPAARNLVLGRKPSKLVVVTLPPILTPFFSELLSGVREGLRESEFNLVIQEVSKPESGEHILSNLDKDGLAGMLVFCRNLSQSERKFLRLRKIPYLLLDYLSKEDHSFAVDNFLGGRMAAEWLFQRGARRPVYLGTPPTGAGVAEERWKGFLSYFQEKNIIPLLRTLDVEGTSEDFMAKGYELTKQFFSVKEHEGVDGIFYFCDEMALGGVSALGEFKINLPVIGFDGWTPSSYLGIATLSQPARRMGKDGANVLINNLMNDNSLIINRLYPPELREPLVRKF